MYPETKEEIAEYKAFETSLGNDPDKESKLSYFAVHRDIELTKRKAAAYKKELSSHKTRLSQELYILSGYLKKCRPKLQFPFRSPITLGRLIPYRIHRGRLLDEFKKYSKEGQDD